MIPSLTGEGDDEDDVKTSFPFPMLDALRLCSTNLRDMKDDLNTLKDDLNRLEDDLNTLEDDKVKEGLLDTFEPRHENKNC